MTVNTCSQKKLDEGSKHLIKFKTGRDANGNCSLYAFFIDIIINASYWLINANSLVPTEFVRDLNTKKYVKLNPECYVYWL